MVKLPYVLLVDDDQTTNYINQRLLKKLDVTDTILVAYDGQQALSILAEQPLSSPAALILLDVNMPGMNGIQFLEHFLQLPLPQQQAATIVMLTTSLHPRDMQRRHPARQRGAAHQGRTCDVRQAGGVEWRHHHSGVQG